MESGLARRDVLRGAGVALALPLLASLGRRAFASTRGPSAGPQRIAWLYVPNGVHVPAWTPAAEGALGELPATLAPLEGHKQRLLVLSGLTHDKARANGDGPGDHARAAAAFLTGAQPFKTGGANLRAGVSADQVLARSVGDRTRLRSLEIGCEGGVLSGHCDSGYSCAYSSTISWATPHTPLPQETSPRLVFERLFLDGSDLSPEERAERTRARRSVLDFVREDARRLANRLAVEDRRKLDEYESCVRELERRIEASERDTGSGTSMADSPGKPKDYAEHLRMMCDLLVLAFRTDTTRIATFPFANEGSNRSYAFLGAPEGHHDLSHHGGDATKQEKVARVNRFHVEQLAYLLDRLAAVEEEGATLLDRTWIVYGSGISDGNRHNHEELPILLCGGGGLDGGRHVRFARETPCSNLHLTLLRRYGVDVAGHGDSTGQLAGLWT